MQPEAALPAWGISTRHGLWPVTVRILFVIDGRIILNKGEFDFGLGYVIDTLRASWSWWVSFEVDLVTREDHISPAALGTNSVLHTGFRFTQRGFDIDRYDQIWFFGDQPNDTDGSDLTTDAHIIPPYTLADDELRRLAEWMDRGGGVFATGDHGVLGASLCSRLPRVRSMRRWTRSQGVPSVDGPRRHQTLQGGSDFLGEGDTLLQPVELVYWRTAYKLPFQPLHRPHALMCTGWGAIDRFPDHMHEGDLIPDSLVQLDQPLGIPGYDRSEYPYPVPEFLAAGLSGIAEYRWRPAPQIIAYGQTTNPYYPTDIALARATSAVSESLPRKRFGLVSVYDGDAAELGRVVCDSTWHHWLSYNLAGITIGDPFAYRKMQAYYRNVGLWLASRSQRQGMLASGVWGALIGSWPGLFTIEQNAWEMGDRAVSILEHTMSPCWLSDIVGSVLDIRTMAMRDLSGQGSSVPDWSGVPVDLVNRAVIGSMCRSLFETAFEHRRALLKADSVAVDAGLVAAQAGRGAEAGLQLVRDALGDAAASFTRLRDMLPGSDTLQDRQGTKGT
jgi:hypothetical protein